MQEKVLEIYNKIKPQLDELKEIAIQRMYDDYFSKNEKTKKFIDASKTKEQGIRGILGDNFHYPMIEEYMIILLDEFLNENNELNHLVPSWRDSTNSNLFLPEMPYHRFSQFDYYILDTKYSNCHASAYRVFDLNGNKNTEDIEKIRSVIESLPFCNFLGFIAYNDGFITQFYEFDDEIVYLFKCIFRDGNLEIVALEIWNDDVPKDTC